MLFILMISLQLSGAVILLIANDLIHFDEKTLIHNYYSKGIHIHRDENTNGYIIPREILQNSFSTKMRNLTSVVLIATGYILAGVSPYSRLSIYKNLIWIVVLTAVLIVIILNATLFISRKKYPDNLYKLQKQMDELQIYDNCIVCATTQEILADLYVDNDKNLKV